MCSLQMEAGGPVWCPGMWVSIRGWAVCSMWACVRGHYQWWLCGGEPPVPVRKSHTQHKARPLSGSTRLRTTGILGVPRGGWKGERGSEGGRGIGWVPGDW